MASARVGLPTSSYQRSIERYDQRAGVVCDPRQFPADRAAALGAVVPVPIIEDKEINAAELTYQLA